MPSFPNTRLAPSVREVLKGSWPEWEHTNYGVGMKIRPQDLISMWGWGGEGASHTHNTKQFSDTS